MSELQSRRLTRVFCLQMKMFFLISDLFWYWIISPGVDLLMFVGDVNIVWKVWCGGEKWLKGRGGCYAVQLWLWRLSNLVHQVNNRVTLVSSGSFLSGNFNFSFFLFLSRNVVNIETRQSPFLLRSSSARYTCNLETICGFVLYIHSAFNSFQYFLRRYWSLFYGLW